MPSWDGPLVPFHVCGVDNRSLCKHTHLFSLSLPLLPVWLSREGTSQELPWRLGCSPATQAPGVLLLRRYKIRSLEGILCLGGGQGGSCTVWQLPLVWPRWQHCSWADKWLGMEICICLFQQWKGFFSGQNIILSLHFQREISLSPTPHLSSILEEGVQAAGN